MAARLQGGKLLFKIAQQWRCHVREDLRKGGCDTRIKRQQVRRALGHLEQRARLWCKQRCMQLLLAANTHYQLQRLIF